MLHYRPMKWTLVMPIWKAVMQGNQPDHENFACHEDQADFMDRAFVPWWTQLFCYVLQMLLSAILGNLGIVLVPDLHLSHLMGVARVWLAFICAASILVSATDAPLSRTSVCRPCPDSCTCLLLNDGTCSVDCTSARLSVFPLDLPAGKRKIVLWVYLLCWVTIFACECLQRKILGHRVI